MDDTYQIPNQETPKQREQPSGQWTESDADMLYMVEGQHDFERWTDNLTGAATSSTQHLSPTSFKQEMIDAHAKENIMREGETRFNALEQSGQWTENYEFRMEYNDIEAIETNLDEWRNSVTSSSGEGL